MSSSLRVLAWLAATVSALSCAAQRPPWDVEKSTAPATTRLDFVATEGTWMSLDVAPDGRTITNESESKSDVRGRAVLEQLSRVFGLGLGLGLPLHRCDA